MKLPRKVVCRFSSTPTQISNISALLPNLKKTKLYGPFLWMGFNCLKATATLRRQFTFYHIVPRNSWYSFYQPCKHERLSRPWRHPVVMIYTTRCYVIKYLFIKNLQKYFYKQDYYLFLYKKSFMSSNIVNMLIK